MGKVGTSCEQTILHEGISPYFGARQLLITPRIQAVQFIYLIITHNHSSHKSGSSWTHWFNNENNNFFMMFQWIFSFIQLHQTSMGVLIPHPRPPHISGVDDLGLDSAIFFNNFIYILAFLWVNYALSWLYGLGLTKLFNAPLQTSYFSFVQ